MISLDDITIDPPGEGVVVDLMSWFDTPGPFELEIGCGKGGFLLSRARENPQLRMLGIEWASKYHRHCADRMARWQLTNVRVMRTDARYFVQRHLPPACVSVLHLYHPDPWPKKRHHKRRLVQRDFVEAVARVLVPCGKWLIQSDHEEYFREIVELVGRCPNLIEIPWEETGIEAPPDWQGTNYEVKYARDGRAIFRAVYQSVVAQGGPAPSVMK
ncbi:MAG: tRNA (guanosine(46)-N7)-methyltransferase TrmB [Planctomycetes bacterium]|nr:tRNA (guanosine(46)-N7)-methyltransferase TrmB [Planctomycetota bacterium]